VAPPSGMGQKAMAMGGKPMGGMPPPRNPEIERMGMPSIGMGGGNGQVNYAQRLNQIGGGYGGYGGGYGGGMGGGMGMVGRGGQSMGQGRGMGRGNGVFGGNRFGNFGGFGSL
jgi:hypothetical protein